MKPLLLTIVLSIRVVLTHAQPAYQTLYSNPNVTDTVFNYLIQHGESIDFMNTLHPDSAFRIRKKMGRWELFHSGRNSEPNIQPGGNILLSDLYGELLSQGLINNCNTSTTDSSWKLVGPTSSDYSDLGVVNAVAVHPSNLNVMYAGTTAGGMFKTTNGGATWYNITDNLNYPGLGVSSILIDPDDADHIIFGSGAHRHGMVFAYGAGIFESYDAGATWSRILLPPTNTSNGYADYFIRKIIYKPTSNDTLYAVSLDKMYRLVRNSGTWSHTILLENPFDHLPETRASSLANKLIDLDVAVSNGQTFLTTSSLVYKQGRKKDAFNNYTHAVLWKSSDDGQNWSLSNLPGNTIHQDSTALYVSIDVRQSNPNVLYALRNNYGDDKTLHVFKSYDFGDTWQFIKSIPTGLGAAGNHIIKQSLPDTNTIYVGVEILYKISYVNNNYIYEYVTTYGRNQYTHADIRDMLEMEINDTVIMVLGHDGGISISKQPVSSPTTWGKNWQNKNGSGLSISQFWGFDYFPSSGMLVGGMQDNGTKRQNSNTFSHIYWGDGNMVRIRKHDEKYYFGGYNQYFVRFNTTNDLVTENTLSNTITPYYQFAPIKVDPTDNRKLWIAQKKLHCYDSESNIYESNNASYYNQISTFAIEPSNGNIIYMTELLPTYGSDSATHKFLKSTDRGNSYTDLTDNLYITANGGNLFLYQWFAATDLIIDPHRPGRLFMSMNGFAPVPGNIDYGYARVVYSPDGGNSWQDMSTGLPPFPVNRLVYQEGTDDVIYAATDMGVYRWNKTAQTWQCYKKDLPPAIVTDIQIDYCREKLICSAWNRGLWETYLQKVETPYHFTQNTTWGPNTFHSFASDIVVDSGVTLIVEGFATFAKNRALTVARGGKLRVVGTVSSGQKYGGKLYNVCGERWGGVRIEGTPTADQIPSATQGTVYFNNATITNAVNAMATYGVNTNGSIKWHTSGGGIIQAYHTHFIDNQRHLEFLSYKRPGNKGNLSHFVDCSFESYANKDISQPPYYNNTGTMITAWDVHGVTFTACEFKNLNGSYEADQHTTDRGTGIFLYDATFIINGQVNPANCAITKRGVFDDLHYGLKGYYSPSNTFAGKLMVSRQDFTLNDRSIQLNNGVTPSIFKNHFNLDIPSNYYHRAQSQYDWTLMYTGISGITTYGTAGALIEQNEYEFNGTESAYANEVIVSTVFDNSLTNGGGGRYRLNQITGTLIGAQTQQNNTALQLTCNQFSQTLNALKINPLGGNATPEFGYCVQGTRPEDQALRSDYYNTFTSNSPFDATHYPNYVKTYVIKDGEPNRPDPGKVLRVDVNNCQDVGAVEPKELCQPNKSLFEICHEELEWPDPNRNNYYMLKGRRNGISDSLDNELYSGEDLVAQAQSDLKYYNIEATQAKNQVLWAYNVLSVLDSTVNYTDSIITFLVNETDVHSRKQLIATYYAIGDYSNASQYLTALPQTTDELIQFKAYYELLIAIAVDDRNIYQLNSEEIAALQAIAATQSSAAHAAQGILTLVNGEVFDYVIERLEEEELFTFNHVSNTLETNESIQQNHFDVFPNPAHQSIVITYDFDKDLSEGYSIKLIDITGKTVLIKTIANAKGHIQISTAS